jgi:hypothetical protein
MSIAHCTIIQDPTKTILVEGNLKDGAISVNICKDYIFCVLFSLGTPV